MGSNIFYNVRSFDQIWIEVPLRDITTENVLSELKKCISIHKFRQPCRLIVEQNKKFV